MRSRPLTLIPGTSATSGEGELVARIQRGDASAFEALFREHYEPLIRYASTFLQATEEARDIVCDVFSALWQVRATWAPVGGVRPYLFGAVRNRCFNHIRDRTRRTDLWNQQHQDDLPIPRGVETTVDDDIDRDAQWNAIRRAIEEMRGLRREAMRLRWIEQMGHAEIALVMGISVNAVQLHLSLALKALRARFSTPITENPRSRVE